MIAIFDQIARSLHRDRVWLVSLAAAAAINFGLLWLASVTPMTGLLGVERPGRMAPVQLVFRVRAPPPPSIQSLAPSEAGAPILPPRFRPQRLGPRATVRVDDTVRAPRLRLSPCLPDDPDAPRAPACERRQDWLRADRDAGALLGDREQGMTLDDVAVARGWIKPKPQAGDRQSTMSAITDASAPELTGLIFKDAPFPPDPPPQAAGP